jgi:hypothetical protein
MHDFYFQQMAKVNETDMLKTQEAGNGQGVWECRHADRRINRSSGREHLLDATVTCISEKYMSSPNYWLYVHKLPFPNLFLFLVFTKYLSFNSKKMTIQRRN